jgi:hypothetical protein
MSYLLHTECKENKNGSDVRGRRIGVGAPSQRHKGNRRTDENILFRVIRCVRSLRDVAITASVTRFAYARHIEARL